MTDILKDIFKTIKDRKQNKLEGSYTCYLFEKGLDKILKKCGEECSETIIAAKNGDKLETTNEICDLLFHLLVLMAECNIPFEMVEKELKIRQEKQKNLKAVKAVDKNS